MHRVAEYTWQILQPAGFCSVLDSCKLGSQAALSHGGFEEGQQFIAKTAFLVFLNYPELQFVARPQMGSEQFAKVQSVLKKGGPAKRKPPRRA